MRGREKEVGKVREGTWEEKKDDDRTREFGEKRQRLKKSKERERRNPDWQSREKERKGGKIETEEESNHLTGLKVSVRLAHSPAA